MAGDVIVSVNGTLVTLMTHPEVVNLIKGVEGTTLSLTVERGDHIIPNMKECFPVKTESELEQVDTITSILRKSLHIKSLIPHTNFFFYLLDS